MANKKRKLEESKAKEDVVMEEETSSSSEVERLGKTVQSTPSSSESESEQEQQQEESEHEKEEEEEEEESEEEKEKSDSEEEAEEMEVDGDEEEEEEEEEAEEEEEEEEDMEKVEETNSSSESEEEATPVVPSKEQSSDSSDSEEEKDGEEEEVMQKQEENSDSSASEEEEKEAAPVVQSKELSSDSEEEEEEGEEATPLVQKLEENSDSSDGEEEEKNEEQQKEKPVEKRKPVKVSIPNQEGPPTKKAKIEKVEGNKEDTRMEVLRRNLEPLQREVLLATMLNVAAKYDEVYADLKSTADILKVAANLNDKKAAVNRAQGRALHVRNLSLKTTAYTLRKAYEKFGDVENIFVPWSRNRTTNRGYGFVTFREKAGAGNALKTPTIEIDGNDVQHSLQNVLGTVREEKKQNDSRTLYVQHLSKAKTTEETFREAFEKFGEVESAHVIRNKKTNESRGFGFVTFREKAGADNALKTPTIEIDGNDAQHSLACDRKKQKDPRALYVRHLSKSKTTEETLREAFKKFGEVESTHVMRDKETNESKGFGFVNFREKAGANNALKAQQIKLHGKTLECFLKH